jgi:hypothetical protein
MLVGMTRLTFGGSVFNSMGIQRMLNFQMTVEAIDLVVCYVRLVQEHVVVDPLKVVVPVMADGAPFRRDVAVSAYQISVAAGAINSSLIRQIVGEFHTSTEVERVLRNLMATGARSQPFVKQLVLEMAKETGRCGHRHVLSLDNLAVATGAAQLFSTPRFG